MSDLFQMEWFDLCLDQFFEDNPYLNREMQNSHYNSKYSYIGDGGWDEGLCDIQMECSTCI